MDPDSPSVSSLLSTLVALTTYSAKSWIVPNYELPDDGPQILRVVVRNDMTEDIIELLFTDIMEVRLSRSLAELTLRQITEQLQKDGGPGQAKAMHEVQTASKAKNAGRVQSHGEGVRPSGHNGVC